MFIFESTIMNVEDDELQINESILRDHPMLTDEYE